MAVKDIQLPELGEGVTEGELVKWLVKVGDRVKADQTIAEMMTDKATVEVPTPSAGVVKELRAKEGQVVEVGHVLITLDMAGAEAAAAPQNKEAPKTASPAAPVLKEMAAKPAAAATPTRSTSGNGMEVHPPAAESRVLATPSTRRLAREMGININQLSGSGIAGRVTRDDVSRSSGAGATQAGAPTFAPMQARSGPGGLPAGPMEERVAIRGIRKKIAENMQHSKHVIPHITLGDEADITALVNLREELKAQTEKTGVKVTYLPFVMKALIAGLREFPMLNASIDDAAQEIVYKKYFNLGFAADTPNGLVVPVIKNADQKTLLQLAREIIELSKKARDGKLALDDMRGATISITNIGSIGSTFATPIINHPEVAILGMYRIQDKPTVKKNAEGKMELDVIKTMNFTVTCDHRLIDGAVAARFLAAFIGRIQNPGVLMLDMM